MQALSGIVGDGWRPCLGRAGAVGRLESSSAGNGQIPQLMRIIMAAMTATGARKLDVASLHAPAATFPAALPSAAPINPSEIARTATPGSKCRLVTAPSRPQIG